MAPGAQDRIARFLERIAGSWLYRGLGLFALMAASLFVVADVGMWLLAPDYNPVSQTISDLAAGPHSWIMDGAILLFAMGVLALTAGFVFRDDVDGKSWVVRVSLVLLAATMLPITLLENYSKRNPEGLVLHPYLVTAAGVLVAVILWFAPSPEERRRYPIDPRLFAGVWMATAPFLDVVPDRVQGLYERGLMWMLMAAVAVAGIRLMREAAR